MKKILLALSLVSLGLFSHAQPPAGEARPGEWYGEQVDPEGAVSIAEVPAKLNDKEAINTKIRAKVLDVCPKKGCWLTLQVNDSTTAMVKMKDYAFFLPLAAKGKTIVLEGEAKIKTTSVAELQHYAEDAKKSKEEIAAITKPQREIRFTATGITIVE